MKNGKAMTRIVPDCKKSGTAAELAEALKKLDLSEEEARAWHKDCAQPARL